MFLFHKLLIKKNIKINSERERERERFASFLLLQITYFPGIFGEIFGIILTFLTK